MIPDTKQPGDVLKASDWNAAREQARRQVTGVVGPGMEYQEGPGGISIGPHPTGIAYIIDHKMVDCDAAGGDGADASGPYHTIIYKGFIVTEDSPGRATTATTAPETTTAAP